MEGSLLFENFAPINGIDKRSFANFTIRNRLPHILDQIIEDNNYDTQIVNAINDLKLNVLQGKIENSLNAGNDLLNWEAWLQPFVGKTWFEVPFYFMETYFYRLILDKTDYYSEGIDPFLRQKENDIVNSENQFVSLLTGLRNFLNQGLGKDHVIKYLLFTSLWGNKSDLSQLKMNRSSNVEMTNDQTLINDSQTIVDLFSGKLYRVDIILDNSSIELFTDLILAEQFLSNSLADQIILHTKTHPTFVSDATTEDVWSLLNCFKKGRNNLLIEFSRRIENMINNHRIVIKNHEFWNSPLHFYDFSSDLKEEFITSALLIFKGDANYRRLFGDRQIQVETKPSRLSDYLPSSSIAIRILKSEIILGMNPGRVSFLYEREKDWKISGKYGMIQLIKA